MVNLGPIDLSLGLLLNINVNNGRNKFEIHISISMAKIADFQPDIGQDATFAPSLNGHITRTFLSDIDIRPHQNDQLAETNRMV